MKDLLLKSARKLSKSEQKLICGGIHRNRCSEYNGPVVVTCAQYHNLPDIYKTCVMVSVDCFPL
ncbi:hypothetical protein ACFSTE_10455 [Aquimarina hainanensis]|uniref:Bacteriocin n=1 Tax=Aquimarina hainanensis TaxID=1578017 RepID=A0ABW5N6J8_9FLAO